ncbi:MAG: hypothetical protein J0H46_17910 [Bacteroidetes bacterium]|nr:hypothetical protein [Bacteroidota bacterium]
MKYLLFLCSILACASCHTFNLSNGRKHRQLFPAKDHIVAQQYDTSKFIVRPFNLSDFENKIAHRDNRRIIEPITGSDIRSIINIKGKYYLYFWNPICRGTSPDLHKLDSISRLGISIMIVSLRRDYDQMDKLLRHTSFSAYPYYTIENDRTQILLVRKINFIREACNTCYERYKDDLAVADYLSFGDSTTRVLFFPECPSIAK